MRSEDPCHLTLEPCVLRRKATSVWRAASTTSLSGAARRLDRCCKNVFEISGLHRWPGPAWHSGKAFQNGHSVTLASFRSLCMTALSNEKNTMQYLMRLVQVLVGAVLQNGGGHPQDCQDAPAWKRRSMWLGDPLEAHILSILEDGLESLIEAVEERQPMIEVALLAKRPVLQMPARDWDMRISRHE